MRIDPKGEIAGWPALFVRRTLRQLSTRPTWGLCEFDSVTSLDDPRQRRALLKSLRAEGLIEAAGGNAWTITPGRTDPFFRDSREKGNARDRAKSATTVPRPGGTGQ